MPFDRYWQNMVLSPIFFIYSDREMFKIISEKGFQLIQSRKISIIECSIFIYFLSIGLPRILIDFSLNAKNFRVVRMWN